MAKKSSAPQLKPTTVGRKDRAGTRTVQAESSAEALRASLEAQLSDGKRQLAGALVSLTTGFVGGYAAGHIAGIVFVGAVLFTGSMFLAYVGMVLTLIVGIYAALLAASRAGAYVAQGHLERDVSRARGWVTSFFVRSSEVAA